MWSLLSLLILTAAQAGQDAAPQGETESVADATPPAILFEVPLPITDDVDLRLRAQIEKKLNELPAGPQRPIFVLEFAAPEDRSGEGSQFERALSLARFLASDRLSRVRTVAFLPRSVKGHAVLPVMACEEIAVSENAEFGEAGLGEGFVDASMRETYKSIADLRRTIPAAVAVGMVDADLEVLRIETLDGSVRYILGDELPTLQETGTVSKVETVAAKGDLAKFSGRQLRLKYGFAAHMVSDRQSLAHELKVSPESLAQAPTDSGRWNVVRVNLHGRVGREQVTRIIRMIDDRQRRGNGCLFVLSIDSPGGSPSDSLRLAGYLAGLDRNTTRTCAFVVGDARADAALPALACDDLVVSETALIGGPGDYVVGASELEDLRVPIRQLATSKGRDWSIMAAMIDPKLQVFRCSRAGTGEIRYFSREERGEQPDPDLWTLGEPLQTADGLNAAAARQLGLVSFSAEAFEDIPGRYGTEEPAEVLEAGWLVAKIEQLASQAWFSRTLLFIAFFALISEASTPGLGIPGFIAGICFMLFFWAQFLNGTAGWLEVILFVGGVTSVLIEVLVLPGFGIFGIGGALMMIASIVLASQTFIIPQNSYQMSQMPRSMFTMVFAGFGGLAAVLVMRRYLAQTPWLRNLMLQPPLQERAEELDRRETLVNYTHLVHKTGVTTTQLTPSGKARFGDENIDVITSGEIVAPGALVVVVEVRGSHVLVQPVGTRG
jgi:membrane-bound ClpP family serine protease